MLETLVMAAVALWASVAAPDPAALTRQPVRRRLLGLIKDNPGIHASELAREMDGSWATVQYHLTLLRKADLVNAMPSGRERRFFPRQMEPHRARLLAILHQGRRHEIADYIHDHPGARQVDICRGLDVSRKTFRASIDPLVDEGLVQERKRLQFNEYFPREGLDALLDGARRD